MKTDKQGISHLSEAEIIERGWTKSGIKKFLGEPDWRPSFRAYGQTLQWRLYREDRVLQMEFTDEWKIWRVRSEKRRITSQKTALAKIAEKEAERLVEIQEEEEIKQQYIKEISSIKIHFKGKPVPMEKLRELGEKNWVPAAYQNPSFTETEKEHSDRVTINYIRHHLTNYDEVLEDYNINDCGYHVISQKVHDLIAKRYPELKDACLQRIAYANDRSLREQTFLDGYDDPYETKLLTSPEMQEKRAQTMVSVEEQKRLGLG